MNKNNYFSVFSDLFEINKKSNRDEPSLISTKPFFILTKIINSNSLSIIIGIISGLAVNIFTNQPLLYLHYISIIFLIISVFFVMILIKLFEQFNEKYYAFTQDSLNSSQPSSPTQNWVNAITFKSGWRIFFYKNLFASSIFFITAICVLSIANTKTKDEAQINIEQSQKSLNSITDSHNKLNCKLEQQNIYLHSISDSVESLKNQNKESRTNKSSRVGQSSHME